MRAIAAILLIVVLAIGGGVIATTAYQAGLDSAISSSITSGSVVTPVIVPYGPAWHGAGFGVFDLFVTLFFVFVVFALLRLVFFRGMWRRGGWNPGAMRSDHGHGGSWGQPSWEGRARETFDTWHRLAHDGSSGQPSDPSKPDAGPIDPS